MDNLETQDTLSTRDRTWKNGQSRDTGNIKQIERGRMDNLETQETLSTRDRTWKNGQSRDTGNIKHKR